MAITFQFQEDVQLKDRRRFKTFLQDIFKEEGKLAGNISFVFCTDEFLLDMNKQYLSHDYYTDIITFDLSPVLSQKIDAEIFISTDRVKENATKFHETLSAELHRVMFHGVLHLCGYNDKSVKQRSEIRDKENYYLKSYFK